MGTQYLNTQFRLRRGTAEAWERNNPVLANGEPGWAVDTKVLKIGDGATHWNDLTYVVNVSDYVTEQELRDAIKKQDAEIQQLINQAIGDVNLTLENVHNDLGIFKSRVQAKLEGFEEQTGNIESMVYEHQTMLDEELVPTLESHADQLDRLAGSVSQINCLKGHAPERIKMEYTNRAGGWKASIKDENTGEEIYGTSLFTRHSTDGWQEHSVEFVNDSTTNATFQMYSVSKEPGVVEIDNVEIVRLDKYVTGKKLVNKNPTLIQSQGGWNVVGNTVIDVLGGAIISGPATPTWNTYFEQELSDVVAGNTFKMEVFVDKVTSGGVNVKLVSSDNVTLGSKYISKPGTYTIYGTATSDSAIVRFGGSGAYVDNLVISSCYVFFADRTIWNSEGGSLFDAAWKKAADWYTWGKEAIVNNERVMQFKATTSANSWYSFERNFTLRPNINYRLSFWIKSVQNGVNIHLKDLNKNTIVGSTFSTNNCPEWVRYSVNFVPGVENCKLAIQSYGQALTYEVYIKDFMLEPIEAGENIIENGNFDFDKYSNGTLYAGKANWELGKYSAIENGAVRLDVSENNTANYVPGCSQNIVLVPGGTYRVSFRSKSISSVAIWMPYTTFTDEDKVAFVSDIAGYENLIFGGPWVQGAAEHYGARVTIDGGHPINAKYLYFVSGVQGADEFEVDVKIRDYKNEVLFFEKYNLQDSGVAGTYKKHKLQLPGEFLFAGGVQIELTFLVNGVRDSRYCNFIKHVGLVGEFVYDSHKPSDDYTIDAAGNIYMNELRAGYIITNIDDGSLDWEV